MTGLHTETIGAGKPLVLVHGWAMHSGVWRRFAEELAKDFQVTLVDLPGHGLSPPIRPFILETVSDAVAAAIPAQACWLGWSLGAEIVIEIVRRFPNKAKGIILLAGNPCFIQKELWPGVEARMLKNFGANLSQNTQAAVLSFLALQVKGIPKYKEVLQELESAFFARPLPALEILQEGLTILEKTDLRKTFSALKMPAAAILGENDALAPTGVGVKLKELLPRLELTIIEKAGHVPFLSHEQAVLMAIRQCMEKC